MTRKRLASLAAGLAAVALTGGVAASTTAGATTRHPTHPASHHVLDVTAVDFAYQVPATAPIRAGLEKIRLHNEGSQPHQADIARLHDGVTFDQFVAALRQGSGPAMALVDFEGGINTIEPGTTAVSRSKLTAGNYVLLCFVQGADGVPHVAKGMVTSFQVEGASHRTRTPATKGTVGLHSYGFDLPDGFGHGTYAVTNSADETHEMSILRVAPGKTAQDVRDFLQATTPPAGPPPFTAAGGMGALSPGRTAYATVDLRPGDYVVTCFVPDDQAPHLPHFMMGMFEPFTVG